jgi:probable O-glycosylation ligase (exosortase A-associated)
MPLRDLLVTTIVLGSLPFCFFRPWIGLLVWAWLGYMNPHRLTWNVAFHTPFSQMVAIATLGGLLWTRDRRPLPRTREVYLMAGLWLVFLLSTTFTAIEPERAWEHFGRVTKILTMIFVTLLLFQDRKRLHILLVVIALSIGFYGLKGGIWAIFTAGKYRVYGPPNSFIGDNNLLGFALNMTLPLLFFLRREEPRAWLRHLLLATFGFSIVAVLITYSRGAFLTLLVVMGVLVLKSRARSLAVVLVLLAVPVALASLPEHWKGRIESIATYQDDGSATQRFKSWYVAYRLGRDHPVFGAGFRPFSPAVYERYIPGYQDKHDAHNIFLQMLAEHGFSGLVLYCWLIVTVFITLRRIMRATRGDPAKTWASHYAHMLETSMIAYLVGGIFVNQPHFDLFYHLVAAAVIVHQLTAQQTADGGAPAPAPVQRLLPLGRPRRLESE